MPSVREEYKNKLNVKSSFQPVFIEKFNRNDVENQSERILFINKEFIKEKEENPQEEFRKLKKILISEDKNHLKSVKNEEDFQKFKEKTKMEERKPGKPVKNEQNYQRFKEKNQIEEKNPLKTSKNEQNYQKFIEKTQIQQKINSEDVPNPLRKLDKIKEKKLSRMSSRNSFEESNKEMKDLAITIKDLSMPFALKEKTLSENQIMIQNEADFEEYYQENQINFEYSKENQLKEEKIRENQIKEKKMRENQIKEEKIKENQIKEKQMKENQIKKKKEEDYIENFLNHKNPLRKNFNEINEETNSSSNINGSSLFSMKNYFKNMRNLKFLDVDSEILNSEEILNSRIRLNSSKEKRKQNFEEAAQIQMTEEDLQDFMHKTEDFLKKNQENVYDINSFITDMMEIYVDKKKDEENLGLHDNKNNENYENFKHCEHFEFDKENLNMKLKCLSPVYREMKISARNFFENKPNKEKTEFSVKKKGSLNDVSNLVHRKSTFIQPNFYQKNRDFSQFSNHFSLINAKEGGLEQKYEENKVTYRDIKEKINVRKNLY